MSTFPSIKIIVLTEGVDDVTIETVLGNIAALTLGKYKKTNVEVHAAVIGGTNAILNAAVATDDDDDDDEDYDDEYESEDEDDDADDDSESDDEDYDESEDDEDYDDDEDDESDADDEDDDMPDPDGEYDEQMLDEMTVEQLKYLANEWGIKFGPRSGKARLMELLLGDEE